MQVAEAVGAVLAELGVDTVFGVVGSGNFHVTNALVAHGGRFVAARHEGGAATMADAYSRISRKVAALTVHQGCGLTNAMTGITEAAKSRTPMLVLAADTAASAVRSNFRIDQDALVRSVGAVAERIHAPVSAVADTVRAFRTAIGDRRTVVLNLPLDIQAALCPDRPDAGSQAALPDLPQPSAEAVQELAELLATAARPVFIAGRGARIARARADLEALADQVGALLATSAVAKGLFAGSPWTLDVSGGFSSPLAAELIQQADVIIGWGCALNMWTLRHGALVGPGATVAQIDLDPDALGAHCEVQVGVVGDVGATAAAVRAALAAQGVARSGYRSERLRARISQGVRWRDVAYEDDGDGISIDPRTLSIHLDDLLPSKRIVAVDSGNFMGYPSMYLSVPDDDGFCFTQAFQSIGLGLASAIGAALARPDRLPVAALGDGGALMSVAELETVVRLGLPMVIVVYNDEQYGAEVHHFGPGGYPLDTVVFPPTDIASIARGFGCAAVTVRNPEDLSPVAAWLRGPRDQPLLIDAKITSREGSWWLIEAFRGH